jgi:hypothetical protein
VLTRTLSGEFNFASCRPNITLAFHKTQIEHYPLSKKRFAVQKDGAAYLFGAYFPVNIYGYAKKNLSVQCVIPVDLMRLALQQHVCSITNYQGQ